MTTTDFQRARSPEAKQQREDAILEAARVLGAQHGIRRVTLTDIAEAVGMHKSALLRYFETREQIFLRLTAAGWRDWSLAVRAELAALSETSPAGVARALAATLAARPMFCDLLAQAPLNLERNVSLEAVRAFKLVTLDEVGAIGAALRSALPRLTERDAVDIIAAATSLSGALWQMATPGPAVEALYRSDPRLAHAVVDVEPRVTRMLTGMIAGFLA
ncbi:TetR/AcrR family transcriptional regulator [Leifsonia sp. NPDC058230]|uniref:TetR/AcrR family transcriptional regulator n=1 Tax=Leifsonia sp. NPDC058230 TaxID=3346391 RepID=UPI0036D83220